MFATLLLGILSVLFAYLAKYKNTYWGLKVSFTLIFLFLALRFNFGNDYWPYLDNFLKNNKYNQGDFLVVNNYEDIGWVILNRLFRPFGFFAMTALLALFNSVIYYSFIKKYIPVKFYWLAVFIYVFSPGFMLTQLSTMRQSLAVMLFVFSLDYLFKKDVIRYFLFVGLGTLFHFSAIILVPVFILSFINWKINFKIGVVIISFFISLFYFESFYSQILNTQIYSYFNNQFYSYVDFERSKASSGLGVLYFIILLILTIYYEKKQNMKTALIFKIAIISFMFIPLGMIMHFIGRAQMYFAIGTIIAYPLIFMNIKIPIFKMLFVTSLIFITLYTFFVFFYSDLNGPYYRTYHTIFSAEKIY